MAYKKLLFSLIAFIVLVINAHADTECLGGKTQGGFCWPTEKNQLFLGWHGYNKDFSKSGVHLAQDIKATENDDVYAIADGTVLHNRMDVGCFGGFNKDKSCIDGGGLIIKHQTSTGESFTALYAHIKKISVGSIVKKGQKIAEVGPYKNGTVHLHFGIRFPMNDDNNRWAGYGYNDKGFYNPIDFLKKYSPYNNSTTKHTARCQGNLCWEPTDKSCQEASKWYYYNNTDSYVRKDRLMYTEVNSRYCDELEDTLSDISNNPNHNQEVPENHGWQYWWRAFLNTFGLPAHAAEEIQNFTIVKTIEVKEDGNYYSEIINTNDITGQGFSTVATDQPIPQKPDFIVTETWLETPAGVETYKFGLNESFNTKAQSKNIGEGDCTGEIAGHFYLSKGYKEDPHSGHKAWRRIDSTTTKCSNLKQGKTHTETKNTNISEWITEPGIYNIVYCIDHPQDDHNNGGDFLEEHESNNCSTEAVFEVTDQTANVVSTDLTVSAIKGASTQLAAGGATNLKMAIRNVGTAAPLSGIRSNYSFCGPLPSTNCVQVADDGSDAKELTQNRDQWEETESPVKAPSTPGEYLLQGCADYTNAVAEANEKNNCLTAKVQVVAARPDFVVAGLGLREGMSIKKGTRVHPWCTVQNVGTGPSPSGIRLAYYIDANKFRDSDGVDAPELCAGCSKFEEVKNNDIKLGDKGTRSYKCCVDYEGAVSESNEANNCSTMSFIVK